jgi:hypothetical protein
VLRGFSLAVMLFLSGFLLFYTAIIVPVQICLWSYDDPCNAFATLNFDVIVDTFFLVNEFEMCLPSRSVPSACWSRVEESAIDLPGRGLYPVLPRLLRGGHDVSRRSHCVVEEESLLVNWLLVRLRDEHPMVIHRPPLLPGSKFILSCRQLQAALKLNTFHIGAAGMRC